jgi:hypothetical protein
VVALMRCLFLSVDERVVNLGQYVGMVFG